MSEHLNSYAAPDWATAAHQALQKADVRQAGFVPDGGLARLIRLCEADATMTTVTLTTEEEGVALAAGAWLGGQRSVLMMQSSGVGNCINMLSLIRVCGFPLLAIVTMRGQWGEFNPWQLPMGQGTPAALEAAGVVVERTRDAAEIGPAVHASGLMAFQSNRSIAVLIGQRIIGFKDWSK